MLHSRNAAERKPMSEHPAAASSPSGGERIRVAVLGARGKMGSAACTAVEAAPDMQLVAEVDLGDPLDAIAQAGATVAMDFTHPDAVMGHIEWCVAHGVHCLAGTDVLPASRFDEIRALLADRPQVGVLVAPIFAVGAVLAMRFAELAAPHFESAELVEMHHPTKVDAPASPAVHTAWAIARARERAGLGPMPDATTHAQEGVRGAVIDGVHVHAFRVRGMLGHLETMLGNEGEVLTIRHDQSDRRCFANGAVLAARLIGERPGLTIGLGELLGL
jgi:4-hydroxy-tetrahydrodipicolinate reductase